MTERVLSKTGLVRAGQQVRPPDLSLTRPGWGSGFERMRSVVGPSYPLAEALWNPAILEAHPDIAEWRGSLRKAWTTLGLPTREAFTGFSRQCQAWSQFGSDVPVALLEVLQLREHPCQGAVAVMAIPYFMHKALLWRYKLVDRKAPVHRLVPLPAIQAFVARLGGWLVKNSDAVELAYVALRTTPVLWDFLKALQTETSLDPMVCEEWATLPGRVDQAFRAFVSERIDGIAAVEGVRGRPDGRRQWEYAHRFDVGLARQQISDLVLNPCPDSLQASPFVRHLDELSRRARLASRSREIAKRKRWSDLCDWCDEWVLSVAATHAAAFDFLGCAYIVTCNESGLERDMHVVGVNSGPARKGQISARVLEGALLLCSHSKLVSDMARWFQAKYPPAPPIDVAPLEEAVEAAGGWERLGALLPLDDQADPIPTADPSC